MKVSAGTAAAIERKNKAMLLADKARAA